jgi:hypothetical protein
MRIFMRARDVDYAAAGGVAQRNLFAASMESAMTQP